MSKTTKNDDSVACYLQWITQTFGRLWVTNRLALLVGNEEAAKFVGEQSDEKIQEFMEAEHRTIREREEAERCPTCGRGPCG